MSSTVQMVVEKLLGAAIPADQPFAEAGLDSLGGRAGVGLLMVLVCMVAFTVETMARGSTRFNFLLGYAPWLSTPAAAPQQQSRRRRSEERPGWRFWAGPPRHSQL